MKPIRKDEFRVARPVYGPRITFPDLWGLSEREQRIMSALVNNDYCPSYFLYRICCNPKAPKPEDPRKLLPRIIGVLRRKVARSGGVIMSLHALGYSLDARTRERFGPSF